jgi:hypothetical protein
MVPNSKELVKEIIKCSVTLSKKLFHWAHIDHEKSLNLMSPIHRTPHFMHPPISFFSTNLLCLKFGGTDGRYLAQACGALVSTKHSAHPCQSDRG